MNLIFNWFSIGNFYLIFVFLGNGIVQARGTDPFFGAGAIVFITLRQLYLFSVIMIFVASLGNRPQGSKMLYTFSFLLFALIMGVMLYMSGFTIYLAVKNVIDTSTVVDESGNRKTDVGILTQLILKPAFRDLVLSLLSTYGVYIVASLLYFDPWHMLTSFVQYLLMVPSFVNILMVYAFCNLHDVSWGTKGDNKAAEPTAPVHTKTENGVETATVDLPTNQGDIDSNYDIFIKAVRPTFASIEADKKAAKLKSSISQEDYFRSFRTRLVLFWIVSNAALVAILTTPEITRLLGIDFTTGDFNPYLTFILWSVAGLTLIRFAGSIMYIVLQRNK